MSTQTEKVNETIETGVMGAKVANAATPKKKRRGISNDTKATTRLKFTHTDVTRYKGLFIGHIEVRVGWVTFGEDVKNSPSFIGKSVPQLIIDFYSTHEKEAERRYSTITIFASESNVDNIPSGSKYKFIENNFQIIKHVLDVTVLKGRELTEQEEEMLELGYVDFDDEGGYEPVEVDDVLKAWAVLFENVVKLIKTGGKDGKSVLLDDKGKPRYFYGKMYRYYKNNGVWTPAGYGSQEGELVFPNYVREGFFEEAFLDANKQLLPPKRIKLDEVRESIVPMPDITRKKPNLPNNPAIGGIAVGGGTIPQVGFMPGSPAMPGVPPTNGVGSFDGAFDTDKRDDLPF